MTETREAYKTGSEEREPWHCPGCGECIGFIYRNPRRLVIDMDNVLFILRGDAEIRHDCGAIMRWVRRLEQHGLLDELGMEQNILSVDEPLEIDGNK